MVRVNPYIKSEYDEIMELSGQTRGEPYINIERELGGGRDGGCECAGLARALKWPGWKKAYEWIPVPKISGGKT